MRVLSVGKVPDPLVGWPLCRLACTEVEGHAAKEPLVLGHVGLPEFVERLARGRLQTPLDQGRRIATGVVVLLVARGRVDQQQGRIRAPHRDGVVSGLGLPAAGNNLYAGLELQGTGDALRRPIDAPQHERVAVLDSVRGLVRRFQRCSEGDSRRLIGGEADDHYAIDAADGKYLACEADAAGLVSDCGCRRVEIQVAAVVPYLAGLRELEHQIAERLILQLSQRSCHHLRSDQVIRLAILAREDQPPRFGQQGRGAGIVGLIRTTCPERSFVELNPLAVNAAEDHSAQPAITDGQGLRPLRGRAAIPDRQGLLRWCGLSLKPSLEGRAQAEAGILQRQFTGNWGNLAAGMICQQPFTQHAPCRGGHGQRQPGWRSPRRKGHGDKWPLGGCGHESDCRRPGRRPGRVGRSSCS